MNDLSWLPPLEPNCGYSGWDEYESKIYGIFRADFIQSTPSFRGKPVRLKQYPGPTKGKEETFWHIISSGGQDESTRTIKLDRCERIRYPLAIIKAAEEQTKVITWPEHKRNKRNSSERRWHLALVDFSYLVVLAERCGYFLLWTGYNVDYPHAKEKLRKRFTACAKTS
jgi:hypothetical protein